MILTVHSRKFFNIGVELTFVALGVMVEQRPDMFEGVLFIFDAASATQFNEKSGNLSAMLEVKSC